MTLGRPQIRLRKRMLFRESTDQGHGDSQQDDDGDYPEEQGNAKVLHGDCRQIRDKHGKYQFGRFQLAHLFFAHQADAHDDQGV